MPSVDKFKLKEKYRSWDNDILSKLTLPDIKTIESCAKQNPNDSALVKKTDNKPTTNRQQIGNKSATNRQQSDTAKQQTDNKPATEPATQLATNRQQTDNKPTTNWVFSSLIGLQREIIIFIYNSCKIARSKITEAITLEHIGKSLKTSCGCIKTTIQRLEAKNLIQKKEYKIGRGGWSRYSIPDTLFQELLQLETDNKLATNWQQTGNKPATEPTTEPATETSSSSSNINNNTTTSGNENLVNQNISLTDEWMTIDIEPLNSIWFTQTHLNQIASQNRLQPKIVQDSINAFAFDLQENNRAKTIKGDPINFFMGILRNGKPYAPPANYESPQDKAMRIYVEKNREIEQRRAAMEKEACDLAFKEWFYKLTDEEITKLLPSGFKYPKGSKMVEETAREYFSRELWAAKRQEILQT